MSTYHANDGYSDIVKAGTPIWEHLVKVKMRYKDTKSLEEIRHFGLPTVGDAKIDEQIHNEWVTIMITINDIVEHFRGGRTVMFTNNEDVETVYNIVNDYLSAWNAQLQRGVNIGGAPFDDLILLDNFAAKLFDQSRKFNGPRKRSDMAFVAALSGGNTLFDQLRAIGMMSTKKIEGEQEEPERHQSFSDTFSGKVIKTVAKTEPAKTPGSSRWK